MFTTLNVAWGLKEGPKTSEDTRIPWLGGLVCVLSPSPFVGPPVVECVVVSSDDLLSPCRED